MRSVLSDWFVPGVCPICGKEDIVCFYMTSFSNYYRCHSTKVEVRIKPEITWIKSEESFLKPIE